MFREERMDGIREMNKIEVNLPQEQIDFINGAHQKELHYWKKTVLESDLNEHE